MQHAVRRTTRGRDRGDRILQGGPGYDLARTHVLRNQVHHEPAGLFRHIIFMRVQRRDIIRPRRADPEELDSGCHRVGRELPTTRARAGTGARLDLAQLGPRHGAGRHRPNRLEDILQGDVAAAIAPGTDGAAIKRQPREVQSDQRHHGGWDRLIAAHDHHQSVEEVAAGDELDRVGDHLAADERGFHALGSHRDAVGHRNRVELHRRSACGPDAGLDLLRQAAVIVVTRHRLDPAVPDADQRLGQVRSAEADGPQHRPRRSPIVALG